VASVDLFFGPVLKILLLIGAMVALQLYTGTFVLAVRPLLPVIAVCCLPLPIGVFLAARQKKCFTLRERQFKEDNTCINHVITR
jgi:hypothetical protein